MRKSILFLGVVCLVSACGGSNPAETLGQKDQSAIREQAGSIVKAFNAKDVPQMLGVYTENLVFMPPNQPEIRGKDALKIFYDDLFKSGATNLKLDVAEVSGHGPLAYESGTYEMDVKPASGKPTRDRGKYLFILRRMVNTWRVEYSMWNSDLAASGD